MHASAQVMRLTPEQLNELPEVQRGQLVELQRQVRAQLDLIPQGGVAARTPAGVVKTESARDQPGKTELL